MVEFSRTSAPKGGLETPFGAMLKRLRIGAGLTQEELAERAHLSVKAISSLERGVNHAPRKDTFLMLARALDLMASDQATLIEAARCTRRLGSTTASIRTFTSQAQSVEWERKPLGKITTMATMATTGRIGTPTPHGNERRGDRGEHDSAQMEYAEAFDAYRAAIRHWDALGAIDQTAAARDQLGGALLRAARYDEALDVLLSAATIYRARGESERLLHTLARIGETHALRGTPVEGIATLARVDAMQTGAASREARAATEIVLAWLVNCTGRYADALPVAERAVEMAGATTNSGLQIQAALRYGHLLLMLGDLDRGLRALCDVLPLAEASGDLRSLRLALNSLGWAHELRGELAHDQIYTERACQVALDLGDPSVIAFMASNHGGPAFNAGDWVGARSDFERGLTLDRDVGESWASPWALVLLGQLDVVQGDEVRGERRLLEGNARAQRNGDLQAQRWVQGTLAERDLLRGNPLTAHRRLAPLINQERPRDVDEYVLLPVLACAALAMGEESRAARLLEWALAYAGVNQLVPTTINALRVRALLGVRQGSAAQARDDLRDALALSEAIQQPYQVAKAHLTWARVSTGSASAGEPREHARAALSLLVPRGERMYAAEAERSLA